MEAVQYAAQIMPLARLSGLLGWPRQQTGNSEPLRVVVHREADRAAGLVVPRIVDIVKCSQPVEKRSDETGLVVGSVLIEGRVTDVIDLSVAFQLAGIRFSEPVGDSA
jgi:chemotaxis signal transduction protein